MGDETACGSHSMMWVLLMNFHAYFLQVPYISGLPHPSVLLSIPDSQVQLHSEEVYAHSSSF